MAPLGFLHHLITLWSLQKLYRPLDGEKAEIRLLRVSPGENDGEISCNLLTASLNDGPVYSAISYCWGDPKDSVPIRLNRSTVQITRSLHGALRRLRQPSNAVTLWADALCINQNDHEERSRQVQVMHIYRKADRVEIWLGEADRLTELAWNTMLQYDPLDGDPDIPALDPSSKVDLPQLLISLKSVLDREWFERAWVIQECQEGHGRYYCGALAPVYNMRQMVMAVWFKAPSLRTRLPSTVDQTMFGDLLSRISLTLPSTSKLRPEDASRHISVCITLVRQRFTARIADIDDLDSAIRAQIQMHRPSRQSLCTARVAPVASRCSSGLHDSRR
jgi:hypothetical protein